MKKVYGVGINDADYHTQKNGEHCPFSRAWRSMLRRSYSTVWHKNHPSYVGCSVVDEWLTFSVFKDWMETQDWESKALDKDLLVPGNKVYGPETCVFVSQMINAFIVVRDVGAAGHPVGVYFDEDYKKFKAQVSNPFTGKKENLGRFSEPAQAHQAWRKRKHELAQELADKQTDSRVAEALLERYNINQRQYA